MSGVIETTKPRPSRAAVNRAGKVLRYSGEGDEADLVEPLSTITRWREFHEYPLFAVRQTLNNRAVTVAG